MDIDAIVKAIHDGGYEEKLYRYLSNYLMYENERLCAENRRMSAQLNLIRAINQGKNEAIDALCERD
jgi:hypothetical protein